MQEKTVKEMQNEIESILNTYDLGALQDLGEKLATSTHRTLQQNFMRLVLAFIKQQSKNYHSSTYDGRNLKTVGLCKQIQEAIDYMARAQTFADLLQMEMV